MRSELLRRSPVTVRVRDGEREVLKLAAIGNVIPRREAEIIFKAVANLMDKTSDVPSGHVALHNNPAFLPLARYRRRTLDLADLCKA